MIIADLFLSVLGDEEDIEVWMYVEVGVTAIFLISAILIIISVWVVCNHQNLNIFCIKLHFIFLFHF